MENLFYIYNLRDFILITITLDISINGQYTIVVLLEYFTDLTYNINSIED